MPDPAKWGFCFGTFGESSVGVDSRLFRFDRQTPHAETKSHANDPPARVFRLFGPSTAVVIEEQFKRTQKTLNSIKIHGYRPDQYGDITGYFLRLDGEYRFLIKGGKHRATVLAHLGHESIPVRFRSQWPRLIDGDRVGEWPLVRSGRVSEDFALAVMRRFFEFDGTQQRDLIFGASSIPSAPAASAMSSAWNRIKRPFRHFPT